MLQIEIQKKINRMMKLMLETILLIALGITVFSQNPDSKDATDPKLKPPDKANPFVSAEGKFSIALPQATGNPVSWDMGIGKFLGEGLTWHMAECSYTLYYAD